MSTRVSRWIYLFLFSLVSGFAQQNGPAGRAEPAASVPAVSAERLMTLDVVVSDKSGKPVQGLQQQDFTLLDNKQPQKILSFQAIEGGAATADLPVEVKLLMDGVNTAFTNVAIERNEMIKFLGRNGGALAQPISLVFFSDSGATETISSRDGNAVVADLNQKQLGLRAIGRAQGFYGGLERMQMSLNMLKKFADYEASLPGRKLLVWISPGWPFLISGLDQALMSQRQKQDLFNTLVSLWDGLRRARITLYNIDPMGTADAGGLRTTDYKQFLKGVKKADQADNGYLALQVLAAESGGRVLNSSNDLAGEIATCVADANSFYVLSFESLPGDGPNEYHALDIKLGKPGLTARTRAGYYAQPESRQK
jgi:VWFA-related protein